METQCASVDALQERLLRLEAIIYGAQGPKATASASVLPSETVLSKINSLQQGLHRLENTAPHLHDFYPKFRQLRRRTDMQEAVDESGEAKQPSDDLQERLAGVASRAAIVCSYDEEARHVERQSRVLSAHLETLENERLKEVPFMTRELKPIEAIHLDQVEAASLLNAQFNDLLNSYNDMINLVSQQFLVWHQRVAKWEVQLGLAVEEPTAAPAPPKKKGKATDAGKRPAKEEAPAAATATPPSVPDAEPSPQEAAAPAAGQPELATAPEAATTVATTQEEQAIASEATATEQ